MEASTGAQPITPMLLTSSRAEQIFPKLSEAQIGRISGRGEKRTLRSGEVLVEQGDNPIPFFVLLSGELETVRPSGTRETLITIVRPREFTGEVNMLSGRRSMTRIRAREPGEVIQVARENLLMLVQTDAELSEIIMRAFILRRVELQAQGLGDATLVGSVHSADTLRLKEFFTRNGHPYTYIDLERDPDVQGLLDQFHIAAAEIPVVICRGETVLRNPTNQEVAKCLGFNAAVDETQLRDLVIVGAGPSGLAAAVYGAS
jgi:thioredoxin reductase (NADPH)